MRKHVHAGESCKNTNFCCNVAAKLLAGDVSVMGAWLVKCASTPWTNSHMEFTVVVLQRIVLKPHCKSELLGRRIIRSALPTRKVQPTFFQTMLKSYRER